MECVFVGIQGSVLALDRATGAEVWRTRLRGRDFVNLLAQGDEVFASARGEVFCLDAATGTIKWNNKLRGMGWGLVAFATPTRSSGSQAMLRRRRDQERAAAASS